jgi:hypothetical protein
MNPFVYTETNKAGIPGYKPTIDEISVKWEDDFMTNLNNERFTQGVRAIVQVSYPINSKGDRRLETFTSGGLWGIDSDSGADYKRNEEIMQLRELKEHLEVFGVDTSDFWQKAGVDATKQEWYQERVNMGVKPAPVLEW